MENLSIVEEDGVVIRIAPTTPETVLTSERILVISEVPSRILSRETFENMSTVNEVLERLVEDAVITAHAG